MARRTWAQLAILYADNTSGDITPERLRDGFDSVTPHESASAPTASDDATLGFDVGHVWIHTTPSPVNIYQCVSSTASAAVWALVYPESASGDVVGPASSVDGNFAVFSGATGKLIADGGASGDAFASSAQGALADTAVQPARSVATQHSLTGGGDLSTDRTLSLVGDAATPGNSKYYGTDGTGSRGYHDLPAGGGASALGDLTDVDTTGASAGDVLTYDGTGWEPQAPASGSAGVEINAQTGTTYTLVLADAGKLVTLDNGAAITLTVPTNATAAFPVGTVIALQQLGAGAVDVVGDTGVTINGTAPGSESLTDAQYLTTAALTKHATDTWTLTGAVTVGS